MGNKKAAAANSGTDTDFTAARLTTVTIDYSPDSPLKQVPCKPWISGPLDQAIAQIEHHRALARFHYGQVLKHKLIKIELERLAFEGES